MSEIELFQVFNRIHDLIEVDEYAVKETLECMLDTLEERLPLEPALAPLYRSAATMYAEHFGDELVFWD